MTAPLVDALQADQGVICLVGAGGKKSTMYALATAHSGRVLLSSTSHMYPYRKDVVDQLVALTDEHRQIPPLDKGRVVALSGPAQSEKRVGGLTAEQIKDAFQTNEFDLCVLKADGARARWLKTPGPHEPVIPNFADVVVPIVSALVVGCALDERLVHRPERVARFLGIEIGSELTEQHIVEILASEEGALKGTGKAQVIPLINMVDDDSTLASARRIAEATLARNSSLARIVLGEMRDGRVVAVIER